MKKGNKIICVDGRKFKNLTTKKEYVVESSDDDFVTVVGNDAGLSSKYAKKYFKASPPPPPPVLTKADILEIAIRVDDGEFLVFLVSRDTEDNREIVDITLEEVATNCGVISIGGVNDLCSAMGALYENHYKGRKVQAGAIEERIKEGMELGINMAIEEAGNVAAVVFSTNNDYPVVWEILDARADLVTAELRSNHWSAERPRMLKTWVIYLRRP